MKFKEYFEKNFTEKQILEEIKKEKEEYLAEIQRKKEAQQKRENQQKELESIYSNLSTYVKEYYKKDLNKYLDFDSFKDSLDYILNSFNYFRFFH